MTPIEFALWLNGAMEITGDQPPTSTQLALIRAKLTETVGGIVASQLLKRAEHLSTREEEERYTLKQALARREEERYTLKQALARRTAGGSIGPNGCDPTTIMGDGRLAHIPATVLDNASLAAAQASYGSKISLNPLQHEDSR